MNTCAVHRHEHRELWKSLAANPIARRELESFEADRKALPVDASGVLSD